MQVSLGHHRGKVFPGSEYAATVESSAAVDCSGDDPLSRTLGNSHRCSQVDHLDVTKLSHRGAPAQPLHHLG